MPILYSNPSEVGADRIVNAIAAFEQFGGDGRPLIVCDFGTATTLDAVKSARRVPRRCDLPGGNNLRRCPVSTRRASASNRGAQT
jgi:hypothetical protein